MLHHVVVHRVRVVVLGLVLDSDDVPRCERLYTLDREKRERMGQLGLEKTHHQLQVRVSLVLLRVVEIENVVRSNQHMRQPARYLSSPHTHILLFTANNPFSDRSK